MSNCTGYCVVATGLQNKSRWEQISQQIWCLWCAYSSRPRKHSLPKRFSRGCMLTGLSSVVLHQTTTQPETPVAAHTTGCSQESEDLMMAIQLRTFCQQTRADIFGNCAELRKAACSQLLWHSKLWTILEALDLAHILSTLPSLFVSKPELPVAAFFSCFWLHWHRFTWCLWCGVLMHFRFFTHGLVFMWFGLSSKPAHSVSLCLNQKSNHELWMAVGTSISRRWSHTDFHPGLKIGQVNNLGSLGSSQELPNNTCPGLLGVISKNTQLSFKEIYLHSPKRSFEVELKHNKVPCSKKWLPQHYKNFSSNTKFHQQQYQQGGCANPFSEWSAFSTSQGLVTLTIFWTWHTCKARLEMSTICLGELRPLTSPSGGSPSSSRAQVFLWPIVPLVLCCMVWTEERGLEFGNVSLFKFNTQNIQNMRILFENDHTK